MRLARTDARNRERGDESSTRAATRHRSFGAHRANRRGVPRARARAAEPPTDGTTTEPTHETANERTHTASYIQKQIQSPAPLYVSSSRPNPSTTVTTQATPNALRRPSRVPALGHPVPITLTARDVHQPQRRLLRLSSLFPRERALLARARLRVVRRLFPSRRFSFAIPGDPLFSLFVVERRLPEDEGGGFVSSGGVFTERAARRARAALGRVGALRFLSFSTGHEIRRCGAMCRRAFNASRARTSLRCRVEGAGVEIVSRFRGVRDESQGARASRFIDRARFIHSSDRHRVRFLRMATKRRASTRLAAVSTPIATVDADEEDADVDALGRAVKRLNTGAERDAESAGTTAPRSEYTEVNAMLRVLHLSACDGRGRGRRTGTGTGTCDDG